MNQEMFANIPPRRSPPSLEPTRTWAVRRCTRFQPCRRIVGSAHLMGLDDACVAWPDYGTAYAESPVRYGIRIICRTRIGCFGIAVVNTDTLITRPRPFFFNTQIPIRERATTKGRVHWGSRRKERILCPERRTRPHNWIPQPGDKEGCA
jgi:hypothetical protein